MPNKLSSIGYIRGGKETRLINCSRYRAVINWTGQSDTRNENVTNTCRTLGARYKNRGCHWFLTIPRTIPRPVKMERVRNSSFLSSRHFYANPISMATILEFEKFSRCNRLIHQETIWTRLLYYSRRTFPSTCEILFFLPAKLLLLFAVFIYTRGKKNPMAFTPGFSLSNLAIKYPDSCLYISAFPSFRNIRRFRYIWARGDINHRSLRSHRIGTT